MLTVVTFKWLVVTVPEDVPSKAGIGSRVCGPSAFAEDQT